VRYARAGDFRQALEQRLMNDARRDGVSLNHRRKLVVFERLLARLVQAAPERWVLKGALALQFRFGPLARMTRDLDLGRIDDEEASVNDLLVAHDVDLGDFFSFTVERARRLELVDGAAIRFQVRASLANRRFEDVALDIGFTDSFTPQPELLLAPNTLRFAGFPSIEIPVVSLDQHIAEKLHAYCRLYPDERVNTRAKDLADLVLIALLTDRDAEMLRTAIAHTFSQRGNAPPVVVPQPPVRWAALFPVLARPIGITSDVYEAWKFAAAFLDPILADSVPRSARWDHRDQQWRY